MASVLAPNERQLSRVFYLALTSGLARQNISSFRDDRASFPSLSIIFLSLFPPFFRFYYRLARFQGYLPRQPPPSFLHFNANDMPYIWQRRHSIRDTFARSEESINPPNECKLPYSRGKGLGLSANDDTGKNLPGEETHYYLGRRRVHLGRRVEPNANERGARVGG